MTLTTPEALTDFATYRRELLLALKMLKGPETLFISKKLFTFSIEGKEWKGLAVIFGKKSERLVRALRKAGTKLHEATFRRQDALLLVDGLGDKVLKDANRTLARLRLPVRVFSGREASALQARSRTLEQRLAPRLKPALASLPMKRDEIQALLREAAHAEQQGDLESKITALERLASMLVAGPTPSQAPKPADARPALAATRPAPAPDGLQVYHGIPTADGGWRQDAGAGRALRVWSQRLQPNLRDVRDRQQRVDVSAKVLEGTVAAGEERLRAALKQDLPAGLERLNRATNGRAFALIKAHQEYEDRAHQAEVRYAAARKAAEAAHAGSVVATAAITRFELGGQKDDLEGQRAALQKRVADRQDAIALLLEGGTMVAGSGAGPAGAVEFGAGQLAKLVGGMTAAETRELATIESRLEALEAALKQEEHKAVRAQLEAARAELAARLDRMVATQLEVRAWRKQKVRAIEQLAALEKAKGGTTVFASLATYQDEASHQGAELLAQTDDYTRKLGRGDFAAIGDLRTRVAADVRLARQQGVQDERWFDTARATDRYLERAHAWRDRELRTLRAQRDQLAQNRHLAIVEETMAQADLALGGTTAHAR